MKKLLKALAGGALAASMMFSAGSVAVFAENEGTKGVEETGTPTSTVQKVGNESDPYTISVSNTAGGATYTVYKMFDLTVTGSGTDEDPYGYSYTINSQWESFFAPADPDIEGSKAGPGYNYIEYIEGTTSVKIKDGITSNSDKMNALASAAKAYATTTSNNVSNYGTIESGLDGNTITFFLANPGYYLITSSSGAKSIIDTTPDSEDVVIEDKNDKPVLDVKEVKEDDLWALVNDANYGDTVEFKATLSIPEGQKALKFHDTMDEALSLTIDTNDLAIVTVKTTSVDENGDVVVDHNGKPVYTTVSSELYTVSGPSETDDDEKCSFEVTFSENFLNSIKGTASVTIEYTATLTDAAVAGTGVENEAKVTYGEGYKSSSTPKITKTYTWAFDIYKYTGTGENEVKLADAEFKISTDTAGNDVLKFSRIPSYDENGEEVRDQEGNIVYTNTYKYNEIGSVATITTDETGTFELVGLDSGTYYITEVKAPAGYNKLAKPVKVVIDKTTVTDTDGNTTLSQTTTQYATPTAESGSSLSDDVVKIENNTGNELPSTGGMGTTILYVAGGILIVGAAIFFITNKRMQRN